MAKFRKLLFGGMIGASLAYLFTRKDVRRRLMGGGRAQLPQTTGEYFGAGVAPAPAAIDVALREAANEKQQVVAEPELAAEPELELSAEPEPVAELEPVAEATEAPIAETEVPAEETVTVAEPEAEAEPEADAEPEVEAAPVIAAKAAEPVVPAEPAPVAEAPVLEAEKTITEGAETDEFADLKTPIEGEPALEEQTAAEAPPELDAGGPAPSQIDRDEMRRRIDETRARLKAKAFDAMISGESFTETEDSEGLKQRPEESGLDKELEDQIDRSMKEQD